MPRPEKGKSAHISPYKKQIYEKLDLLQGPLDPNLTLVREIKYLLDSFEEEMYQEGIDAANSHTE